MARRTLEDLEEEVGNGEISTALVLRSRNHVERIAKRRRLRNNDDIEACCSCTRHSRCQTTRCRCYVARIPCSNCQCLVQCSNRPEPPPFTMHGNLCGVTTEGDEEADFAPHSGLTQQQTNVLPPPPSGRSSRDRRPC